jgi:hypothetical protein
VHNSDDRFIEDSIIIIIIIIILTDSSATITMLSSSSFIPNNGEIGAENQVLRLRAKIAETVRVLDEIILLSSAPSLNQVERRHILDDLVHSSRGTSGGSTGSRSQDEQQQQQQQHDHDPLPHPFECPICKAGHWHDASAVLRESKAQIAKHKCSHGATRIFVSIECPICMELKEENIAMSCGHVMCIDDFKYLGGRVGG